MPVNIGSTTNPYTLTGTQITETTTNDSALSLRVHRQGQSNQYNVFELWYNRESIWNLFPLQPDVAGDGHPTIVKDYGSPVAFQCTIQDVQRAIHPKNRNSALNYKLDGVTYDPLIDEARPIIWRTGCRCYSNAASGITPTSTLAPSSGALSGLTDGSYGDIAAGTTGYIQFTAASASPFTLKVDLGSIKTIWHAVIRLASKVGTCSLPASVTFSVSKDDITYKSFPAKPCGGTGGDWDEDYVGQTPEFIKTEMEELCRYVKITITPVGAQTILIDELAIYGGTTEAIYGYNSFTGYLGESTKRTNTGLINIKAIGRVKKLMDNTSVDGVTAEYKNQDVADIVYLLLTSTQYWKNRTSYSAPFGAGDIAWAYNTGRTDFKYPVWQGVTSSIYGFVEELLQSIGMELIEDGNGVFDILELPFRQFVPDRVLVADQDGNGDVWACERDDTGKNIRNTIIIRSSSVVGQGVRSVMIHPSSIARFDERDMIITDPLAVNDDFRTRIGRYVLRDYAFRQEALHNMFVQDKRTKLKSIFGFRAQAEPNLYCKDDTTGGSKKFQELWALEGYDEHFTIGRWYAEGSWFPYYTLGPGIPTGITATPHIGVPTQIDVTWTAVTDSDIIGYRVYISTSELSGYTLAGSTAVGTTTLAVTGLANGTRYYFYVVAVGRNGVESFPSSIVSAIAGTAAGDDSKWTVTDLAVSYSQVITPLNGNPSGYYEYEFLLEWTSPPVGASADDIAFYGTKSMEIRYAVSAVPSNPTLQASWTLPDTDNEWHGDRIPSTYGGQLAYVGLFTAGQPLQWRGRFRVSAPIASGTTIYWRMWTWQTTNGRRGTPHPSNTTSTTIP